jgi:hypothetical protein
MTWRNFNRGLFAIALCVTTGCVTRYPALQRFHSPQEALSQLERVVSSGDKSEVGSLFGSEGDYLLDSGDAALDRERVARFTDMFKERHDLEHKGNGTYVVLLGKHRWPFAVPIVQRGDAWVFDATAGKEEVIARRIGENEFSALDTARTVYLAQRQYAATDWNGDSRYQYAERLISTPGARDGLYWPAQEGDAELSPLNAAVAKAADENYVITPGGEPQPFHGYYHKLRYSPTQPGKQVDALSRPGHYWLISVPAVWNESGVMTFASNERGWIYQKNLGPDFDYTKISDRMIDRTWTRVE